MPLQIGIAGLGTIGMPVARALDGKIPGLELVAIASGRHDVAEQRLAAAGITVPVVTAANLAEMADVIVECAPANAFRSIAVPVLSAARMLITVSGAALLEATDIIELAERQGGRIILATGALLGLDAVRAAAEGHIHSIRMVSRKSPRSLRGAPYLQQNGIDVESITNASCIFRGSAREGARGFPANVNVAAALSLAGIGPDRTELEIWADPSVARNIHTINVDAESAHFIMTIENVPSVENPATGQITALSVIAALRSLRAPLRVGT